MYNERLESLIDAALADGELTEKEKQVLYKNAQTLGVDLDEFEMVLDARLYEKQKAMKKEEAAAQPQVTSAPKSEKFGDVRKCPQCGAVVPALSAICPECGYEFVGIEANSSSVKLNKRLQEITDQCNRKTYTRTFKDKLEGHSEEDLRRADMCTLKAEVITSFPVPGTKEDLLEFAVLMQTGKNTNKNRTGDGTEMQEKINSLHHAYSSKFDECITKMKMMFPNDPMFKSLLSSEEEIRTKVSEKKGIFGKLFGK